MKPLLPKGSSNQGIPPNKTADKTYFVLFSDAPVTICWKCDDSPCIKKSELISPNEMLVKGSNVPNYGVCPTSSISQNRAGEIEIDSATCIGCGLCVSSCPVNALNLNTEMLPITNNSSLEQVGMKFAGMRLDTAEGIEVKNLVTDSKLISSSLKSIEKLLKYDTDGKSVKLFVRNIFLKSQFKCRMRIEGDTNDPFELVAETSETAYPIEIAVGGDTLDSTRRILSGCARLISRGIIPINQLRPILIVDELPNSRSDVYRVIEDMDKYLGLQVRMIPLAILQLLSYTELSLEQYFNTSTDFPASEWFWRSFLSASDVEESVLERLKLAK
jgi:ferredoxin